MNHLRRRLVALSSLLILASCKSVGSGVPSLSGERDAAASDLARNNGETAAKALVRLQVQFDILRQTYATVSDFNQMPQKMIEVDLRVVFMRIEAIARSYSDYFKDGSEDAKRLENIFKQAKSLEDNMGVLADAVKLPTVLDTIKAPADLIAFAKKKSAQTLQQFVPYLKQKGWGPDLKSLTTIESVAKNINWPKDESEDRVTVISRIAKESKDIAEKSYPLDDLDKGIHQLRKDLRWVLLETQASNGLIVRDDSSCPIPEYQGLVIAPVAASKYGVLSPSSSETNPCKITGCTYLAVVTHNLNIGDLKDFGLWEEQIAALLKQYKPTLSEASVLAIASKLIRQHPNYRDPATFSKLEHKTMDRTGILPELAKELRQCHSN